MKTTNDNKEWPTTSELCQLALMLWTNNNTGVPTNEEWEDALVDALDLWRKCRDFLDKRNSKS